MLESLSSNAIYAVGLPIAFGLIVIEAIYSAMRKKGFYHLGDSLGSLGLFMGNIIMVLLTKGIIFGFNLYLFQFNVFNLSDYLPFWVVFVLSFFIIDFTFYWYHRASHRVRFLWAIHMNHHSSEEMNFLVAFRQAWFNPFSKIPFFMFLPLFLLDPTITVVAGAIATLIGVLGHTQIVDKLGLLEYIFNTPSHHRVHHGSNPEYIDKNYGNLFIIWDKIFGTFEPEVAPVIYGIKDNVNTYNPVKITFRDWLSLAKDIKNSHSIKEALSYIVSPPDWKP
tara:strand:+ start:896 stop:1732 length:837 start_codon:yes stop_codon:yes gene_type:complete